MGSNPTTAKLSSCNLEFLALNWLSEQEVVREPSLSAFTLGGGHDKLLGFASPLNFAKISHPFKNKKLV